MVYDEDGKIRVQDMKYADAREFREASGQRAGKVFMAEITALTPSQLYISQKKLTDVRRWFQGPLDIEKMEPVPVRNLAGRLMMTDGHTRAAVAFLYGIKAIPCVWDGDDLDWAAYAADLNMCAEEGILSVEKLAARIVSASDYKRLWNDRCDALYDEWYYQVLKQKEEIIYFTRKPVLDPNPVLPSGWEIRPFDMGTETQDIEYFQLCQNGIPTARGCIERYSFEFWEAADIRTDEKFRRKGFGTAMTAYLTNRIVSAGKTATCRTRPENVPMRCTIEKCGYERLYE